MRSDLPRLGVRLPSSQQEPVALRLRSVLGLILGSIPEVEEKEGREQQSAALAPVANHWKTSLPQRAAPTRSECAAIVSMADDSCAAELLLDIVVGDARYLLLCIAQVDEGSSMLSPREREIVRLVARGFPNKTIAETLEISPWTVNTYLRRIFAKLDVTSRSEMVASAISAGLLHTGAPSP